MRYTTTNPATGEALDSWETFSREETLAILARTDAAFRSWRRTPLDQRTVLLTRLAAVLRERRDEHARDITLEMGKPIVEARAEVEKCAWLCDVYAERGAGWLAELEVAADGRRHRVAWQPLGVVLAVMPWNFPFWQALRFAVPTLLAGNAGLLKHARNVPRCAFAIEAAFREAGFPEHLFRNVLADHGTVGALIDDDRICGVSLTGSTAAGERVAERAGRALKKVVLELGGSDPFIVLDDADIEIAAAAAVRGRALNTGQSCIAAKRFIVAEPLVEAFTARFAELMAGLKIGDPLDESVQVGPLVDAAARDEAEGQLRRTLAMGARLVCGGGRPDRPGFYLEPAVVAGVTPAMPLAAEEVFAPIAPVLTARDDDEAVAVANAGEFGLGGSVWTRDLERGEALARRLEAGSVFVNSIVKSDPRMPFGGVKKSGLGRELAEFGLREFVNIQGVNVYDHA